MTTKTPNRNLYSAIHHWLKHRYGKAISCDNPNCEGKSKNYDWAKKKGKEYDFNRDNFIHLCKSCHSKYDFTEETRKRQRQTNRNTHKTHCMRGHAFSEKDIYVYKGVPRRQCKICKRDLEILSKVGRNHEGFKPVNQLSLSGEFLKRYKSVNEATESVGLRSPSGISGVLTGLQKTAGKYKWEYAEVLKSYE